MTTENKHSRPTVSLVPSRRLCAVCLTDARREVSFGTMRFALCDDCLWDLRTAIEEAA